MIGYDILSPVKPERADLVEYLTFERDRSQYPVESALSVSGYKKDPVSEIVNISDFTAYSTGKFQGRCICETIGQVISDNIFIHCCILSNAFNTNKLAIPFRRPYDSEVFMKQELFHSDFLFENYIKKIGNGIIRSES